MPAASMVARDRPALRMLAASAWFRPDAPTMLKPPALSATPGDYTTFRDQAVKMAKGGPNWTDAQLRQIRTPIWIVGGEHDEGIKREHTEKIAATISNSRLVILPNVSHFAFLQDPTTFNTAMLTFLREQYPAASKPRDDRR